MRLQTITDLFDYWHRIRGGDAAPLKSAVEPSAVKHILSSLFILDGKDGAICFRLAGTSICELFGRDPVGQDFASLWGASQRNHVAGLASGVMAHLVPAHCHATGYSISGHRGAFEIILMPLRSSGENSRLILGALAPATTASWLRIVPLEMLALDRSRLLHEHLLPKQNDPMALFTERQAGLAQSVLQWEPQAVSQHPPL